MRILSALGTFLAMIIACILGVFIAQQMVNRFVKKVVSGTKTSSEDTLIWRPYTGFTGWEYAKDDGQIRVKKNGTLLDETFKNMSDLEEFLVVSERSL